MRQRESLGNTCGDRHRPVDPRRNQPLDPLGTGQPLDARLVLGREDRAPVGVAEPRRRRIAVDRDHMQVTRPRCGQEAELRRARA